MHRASPSRFRPVGWFLLGLALCLPLAAAGAAQAGETTQTGRPIRAARLIITTSDGAAPATADMASGLGVVVTRVTEIGGGSFAVDLSEPVSAAQASGLRVPSASGRSGSVGRIVSAIPDQAVQAADLESVPLATDPRAVEQWALWDPTGAAGGQSIRVGQAWRTTTGDPDVVVAVIDTGITEHPDLDGQIVAGRDFISDELAAGDGDGVDDDPSDEGDFSNFGFPGCPMSWSSWHGTHVTGAVAARMDDTGVVGAAPGVRVAPIRILGRCGGSLADLIAAIRWAVGEPIDGSVNPHPARVISMSLSGIGSCPSVLATAISFARSRGAAVMAAAGNSLGSAAAEYPANCPGVHAVTATGRAGQRASYANTGAAVAIAAPGGSDGERILSTSNSGDTVPVAPNYRLMQGTSMATPLVSAAVALVLSANPALTAEQAWARVASNAREFPQATGRDCTPALCGVGMLDLVGLLPDPPGLTLSGWVTRGAAGTRGVSVAALPTGGGPGFYGRTSADGSYRIAGLPAGSYQVRFTHGPAVAWHDDMFTLAADATDVDHDWPGLASISGAVVAAGSGNPLPGVDVGLAGSRGAELFRRATSDASGRFAFTDLEAGGYRILAGGNTDTAVATWWGGPDYQGATVIAVTDGNDRTGVQVEVAPRQAVQSAATTAAPQPVPQPAPPEPVSPSPTSAAPPTAAPATPQLRATVGKRNLPGTPRVRITPATEVTLTATLPAGTVGTVQFADSAGVLGQTPISGTTAVLRTRLRGGQQAVVARILAAVAGPDSTALTLRVVDRTAPQLRVAWVARSHGNVAVRATDRGGVATVRARTRSRTGRWGAWSALAPNASHWTAPPTWGRGSCLQLRATDWAGNRSSVKRCR